MSRQMVYTSAPEGLKRGSSGFCTVAADGGMSPALMTKLEFLSGYEFRYNLSDPDSDKNPVSFCHTQIKLGGRTAHVLSRVAACGADYSGRTNKIAHHFLLEDGELLPCGPAQMIRRMEAKGLFWRNWNGPPQSLEALDLAHEIDGSSNDGKLPEHWESHGDAGWGGLLPRAFCRSQKLPSYVLFEPGTELLPLFGESLQMLPARMRWDVDFATYYASSPPNCHYHWRGILAGSAAIREAARFPNAVKLDLTRPLGAVPASEEDEFTKAARRGQVPPSLQEVPAAATAARAGAKRSAVVTENQGDPSEAALAEADSAPAALSESDRWDPRVVHKASTLWAKWILIMFSASVFAVVIAFATWAMVNRRSSAPVDKAVPRVARESLQRDSDRGDSSALEKGRSSKASADASSAGGKRENVGGEANPDSNSESQQEQTDRGATGPGREGESGGQDANGNAERKEEMASPVTNLKAERIPPQSIKLIWRWRIKDDPNARLTLQRRCGDGEWELVEKDIKTDQEKYRDHRLSPGEYQYRFTLKKPQAKPETIFPKVSIPRLHIIPIPKLLWTESDSVHETIWLTTELRKEGGAHLFPEDIKSDGEFKLVSISDRIGRSLEMEIAGDVQDDTRGQYIAVRPKDEDNPDGRELLRAYIKKDPNKEQVWLVCDPNEKAWLDEELQAIVRHCAFAVKVRLEASDRILRFVLRPNPDEKNARTVIECGWAKGERKIIPLRCPVGDYPWPTALRIQSESGGTPDWCPQMTLGKQKIDMSLVVVQSDKKDVAFLEFKELNDLIGKWGRNLSREKELLARITNLNNNIEKMERDIKETQKSGQEKEEDLKNKNNKNDDLIDEVRDLKKKLEKHKEQLKTFHAKLQKTKTDWRKVKPKAKAATNRMRMLEKGLNGRPFSLVDPWGLPVAHFKISCKAPPEEKGSDQ